MLKEYEILKKDSIKFYFLREALESAVTSFRLFLESDAQEKDFSSIRSTGKNGYRFNNFTVTEDAANNCITFRPNVIGCYVCFTISTEEHPVRVELLKNGSETPSESFELPCGVSKLDFYPREYKKYALKISCRESETGKLAKSNEKLKAEIGGLEEKKKELLNENLELKEKKRKLEAGLESLKRECDKDYLKQREEAEELRARYGIDEEILKLYADKNVTPVEELRERVEADLKQLEEQIAVFVTAREKKQAEIESEMRGGKKA